MKSKKKKIIVSLCVVFIILAVAIPFGASLMIYNDNFGRRYESYAPTMRSTQEFEGLNVQKYTFTSNKGQQLAGYTYDKGIENPKGLIIIAHGFGGGGHNWYMDVADYLASNGYIVFAYDATGNDESEGTSVQGLPQGIIDLDYAIRFIKDQSAFEDLPIMLFGHSWGAYSAGSVLNLYPDINAVVMVVGFNKSTNLIQEEGRRIAGSAINVLVPYLTLIEKMKFGPYASYNCLNGFQGSTAGVMLIHSADDPVVSIENSFNVFYDQYKDNERFTFVQYEDRGHNYVYYTDDARQYTDTFNKQYAAYRESLGETVSPAMEQEYYSHHLDKRLMFELDEELMQKILAFYDSYAQ